MRTFNNKVFFLTLILLTAFQSYQALAQTSPSENVNFPAKPFSFPLQLEMHVPVDPTAFPSGSKSHLIYELYLTNFSGEPIKLCQIELINGKRKNAQPVAVFNAEQLQTMVQLLGETTFDYLTLAGGQAAIVFIEAIVNAGKPLPDRLIHRVVAEADSLDGAVISTHQTKLQVFGSPVKGAN